MLFGLNYSPQAAELVRAGQIAIDRFKCPGWDSMVAEAREVVPPYIHFELFAGTGEMEGVDWANIERLLRETDTPYVNVHLVPRVQDYPTIPTDPPNEAGRALVIERMTRDVAALCQRFGADRVIVENIPYEGAGGKYLRPCVEPDVFCQVLHETGAALLLDISHARVSARALSWDEKAYIEALPLDRLRELHITGLQVVNGRLTDHMELGDDSWAMVAWMLDKIRAGAAAHPWIASFEYGGSGVQFAWRSEARVIAAQVPPLYAMVKGV